MIDTPPTKLSEIDDPALYDAMDILAFCQDGMWDSDRIMAACRMILDTGTAADAFADKLREYQKHLPPKK